MATELFQRGKALIADGKTEEACRAFGESQKLEPSSGTLLNLAVCHEKLGLIASAWSEYHRVVPMARIAGRQDRVDLAEEKATALAPKLSRVVIDVPPASAIPGLVLRVDGAEIDDLLWGGAGLPEDPGRQRVEASAKGRKLWTASVNILADADIQRVSIPVLEEIPVEATPEVSGRAVALTLAETDALANARARRFLGFATGGLGVATAGVGIVFGVLAVSANSDSKSACPNYPETCPSAAASTTANDKNAIALSDARIANVTLAVGGLLVAVGAIVVLTALPPKPKPTAANIRALRLLPSPLPGGAAMVVGGSF